MVIFNQAKAGKPRKSIMKAPEAGDEDEWAGFSDEDSSDKTAKKTPTADATEVKENKKPKKEKKKAEQKTGQPTGEKSDQKPKEQNDKKKPDQKAKQQKPKKDQSMKGALSFEALEEDEDEDSVDVSAWDELNLSPEIYTSLSKMKFSSPSAIQKASIPAIMDGHDVVGKASTGSGKTLAFSIPIIEHYLDKRGKQDTKSEKSDSTPIALILSPTRELAHQLAKHIGELTANAPDTNARIALLTGGLSIQKQQRQLAAADIVVGTPGRVWEILSQGQGLIRKMQKIKFLVVDEADRLLSEGHFKEVEDILGALDKHQAGDIKDMDEEAQGEEEQPSERQTLVFSATFHRDLQQKLAGKGRWTNGDMLDNKESMEYLLKKLSFREEKPKFIDVNPVDQMAQGLKEGIVECPAMEKVSPFRNSLKSTLVLTLNRIFISTQFFFTTPNTGQSYSPTPFLPSVVLPSSCKLFNSLHSPSTLPWLKKLVFVPSSDSHHLLRTQAQSLSPLMSQPVVSISRELIVLFTITSLVQQICTFTDPVVPLVPVPLERVS
jgi:ATP-dependent RNA helicase DDX24/MAK5